MHSRRTKSAGRKKEDSFPKDIVLQQAIQETPIQLNVPSFHTSQAIKRSTRRSHQLSLPQLIPNKASSQKSHPLASSPLPQETHNRWAISSKPNFHNSIVDSPVNKIFKSASRYTSEGKKADISTRLPEVKSKSINAEFPFSGSLTPSSLALLDAEVPRDQEDSPRLWRYMIFTEVASRSDSAVGSKRQVIENKPESHSETKPGDIDSRYKIFF